MIMLMNRNLYNFKLTTKIRELILQTPRNEHRLVLRIASHDISIMPMRMRDSHLSRLAQWKSKYYCLQKQSTNQIGLLKQKIYQQCSTLMHNQFLSKQKSHAQIVNAKNVEIQQLTSRVIRLQTACKIAEKEKEVLMRRVEEEERRFAEVMEEHSDVKTQHLRRVNIMQENNLSETGILKVKITQVYQAQVDKLQKQNQHLKHKISEFQKRYTTIIPQVEKLKGVILKKTAEVEGLEQQRQKMKQAHVKEVNLLRAKYEQLQTKHSPCVMQISELSSKLLTLQSQLAKAKLTKKQIRVQPVYVDRPVQVQRVVEKLIQVQRIVKQYIQPTQDYQLLQQENKKLNLQLQNIIHQLKLFQNRYQQLLTQNQQTVQQYEENLNKYKTQRESLVNRIHQQDQQLERIFHLVNSQQYANKECTTGDNQKIVVHVSKDGTVNKRVEKINVDQRVKATVSRMPREAGQYEAANKTQQKQKQPSTTTNYRATKVTTTQQVAKKK